MAEIVVSVTFRHDTSRNLDPALHTHSVIANMVRDADGRDAAPPRCAPASSTRRSGTAPLTAGQKEAVKLIVSAKDRVVGVQGYAGTGKTTMLRGARALMEKKGYEVKGLAPSASAARTGERASRRSKRSSRSG